MVIRVGAKLHSGSDRGNKHRVLHQLVGQSHLAEFVCARLGLISLFPEDNSLRIT